MTHIFVQGSTKTVVTSTLCISPGRHLPLIPQIRFPWQSWSLVHPKKQGSTKTVVTSNLCISPAMHLPLASQIWFPWQSWSLVHPKKHVSIISLLHVSLYFCIFLSLSLIVFALSLPGVYWVLLLLGLTGPYYLTNPSVQNSPS